MSFFSLIGRLACLVAPLALVVGCGGATLDPGSDGGADSSPPSDGGLGPSCPATVPNADSPCSKEGLSCEYGSDPNLSCNTYAQCSLGRWQVMTPPPSGCPTPPNPSSCPSTYASVPVGQLCGNLVGLLCSYPLGFCGCEVPQFGPYPADGAAVAQWVCDQPEQGCPQPRPKLGSVCTQPGQMCDYGACSLPTGTSVQCQDGAWQNAPFGCAL
ncbi:MAG TPA: hypothetical protein VLM85_13770 [Polyangiaceae bacterium]|nr:hypothetical protein [Polyangiaceae bacterium]